MKKKILSALFAGLVTAGFFATASYFGEGPALGYAMAFFVAGLVFIWS